MDKIIYSISKSGINNYILENKEKNEYYKFNNFSEIIDVFSHSDTPLLLSYNPTKIPLSPKEKVDIHIRIVNTQNETRPKYFWSKSYNKFDRFERISIRDVLKHIRRKMKGW